MEPIEFYQLEIWDPKGYSDWKAIRFYRPDELGRAKQDFSLFVDAEFEHCLISLIEITGNGSFQREIIETTIEDNEND